MSVSAVLVVDDEPQNRDILERLLVREGYDVHTADRGETALAMIADHAPDVVLLDVQMPGIDGFEVCRQIKQNPKTRLIPVVLVTGLNAREHRIEGIKAGADDFITKPFDREELKARVHSLALLKRYTSELDSAESIIMSLALTIEARDSYTKGHCDRLVQYATALGTHLQLTADQIAALRRGAYVHDIGKIGIPDAILLKRTPLTASEYARMKEHTLIGDRLCGSLQSLELVRPIVRHHHERLDGSGYPDGLRGDQVPFLAQIVNIVDTFDAITTNRPYHAAQSAAHAFSELEAEVNHGWRRRDLVEAFVRLEREGAICGVLQASAAST